MHCRPLQDTISGKILGTTKVMASSVNYLNHDTNVSNAVTSLFNENRSPDIVITAGRCRPPQDIANCSRILFLLSVDILSITKVTALIIKIIVIGHLLLKLL